MPSTASRDDVSPTDYSTLLDSALDWLAGGLLVFEGLVVVFGGFTLASSVDREVARSIVADLETGSTVASDAVLVDAVYNIALWGGVGFGVMGLLFVAGALAFRRYRNGVRERYAPGEDLSRRDAALNGGVLAIAGSVVPFAVVGGGGIAGYLRGGRGGTLAGFLAGLVVGAPMLVVGGPAAAGALAAGAPTLAAFIAVATLVIACLYAPFAAVGGFFGGLLAS